MQNHFDTPAKNRRLYLYSAEPENHVTLSVFSDQTFGTAIISGRKSAIEKASFTGNKLYYILSSRGLFLFSQVRVNNFYRIQGLVIYSG